MHKRSERGEMRVDRGREDGEEMESGEEMG
jgi:hypothetical protein